MHKKVVLIYIKITAKYFGVNTLPSGNLQFVLAKVMNY